MAVSFKIPKSPKRDVFAIDTFEGVDFSNTVTSIEPTKSPNAENMVRLVPGKVRKRTGYKSRVVFSDGTDVNRAIKSSDQYVDIDISQMGDTPETGIVFSEFYDLIPAGNVWIRFETEGQGSYQFVMYPNDPTTGWQHTYRQGGESRFYYGANSSENSHGTQDLRVYRTADAQDGDFLRIKKVFLATSGSDYARNLPWTPAPEDGGGKFVKRATISPVYGCHILKTYDANRVVNVNRALNTTSTFDDEYTITDSAEVTLADLAEPIYRTADTSVRMYIEFDYMSDGAVQLFLNGWHHDSPSQNPHDTGGTNIEHFSVMLHGGGYSKGHLTAKAFSGTVTFYIKNLSIMYEKDNDYVWSKAPEDTGGTFHIEDIYYSLPNNYAINEDYYYTGQSSSLVATANIPIGDANSHVAGFAHISFDLETSASESVSKVIVRVIGSYNDNITYEKEFNANITESFDLYLGAGYATRYFERIQVEFRLADTDATCLAYAKNIQVRQIQPQDDYSIFSKNYLYHVGKDFYLYTTVKNTIDKIFSNANQATSQSLQLNDKMVILDGKNLFLYEFGQEIENLTDGGGHIPTITISKTPGQGVSDGTAYEALNLIQPKFTEKFVVDEDHKTEHWFQLSFSNLDTVPPPKVEVLQANGTWQTKVQNVDYYPYSSTGRIYFLEGHLPGKTPISGEDNVRITASRTVTGYKDRIAKCSIGAIYGEGGNANRLFLSGNPDHPNWDFYSGQNDPTYFPDTGYSVLGSSSSAIVGYAVVNNYLATFKDEYDPAQNVTIREGELVLNSDTQLYEPVFKTINTLQGNGVVAPYSFAYLQTEPLFLTRSGICAITPQDITGERYSQNRSFYLNGKLTKESDLASAKATVFDDQYILALGGKLYILDGLQPLRTDKSMPYATRQYAGFYCTNVPASCIWIDDQALWIGTFTGKIARFDTDIQSLESYNDDGLPIYCCWETPDLDGNLFYKNKTFRYFAIRVMSALRTSVKLYSQKLGTWSFIKEDKSIGTIFDFDLVDFERFSFNTDTSAKVAHTKVRVKKVDKAQFRVENGEVNEPFGLYDLALEYIESGNYKG